MAVGFSWDVGVAVVDVAVVSVAVAVAAAVLPHNYLEEQTK